MGGVGWEVVGSCGRVGWACCLALGLCAAVAVGCGSSSSRQGDASGGRTSSDAGASSGGLSTGAAGASGRSGGDQATAGGGGRGDGDGGAAATTPVQDHALASVDRGACALDNAGGIQCWGFAPNTWVIPAGTFVELHASLASFCAVRADRTVTCFDPPSGGSTSIASMIPTDKVQMIELGLSTICGANEAGAPFCKSAYLGLAVPAGGDFSQYSVGYHFACGIRTTDRGVTCWGNEGDATCSLDVPALGQLKPPSGAFVRIASGVNSSCAVDTAGSLSCWGAGKTGDDTSAECRGHRYNFGQSAAPSGAFRALAVGENHSCGIKTDGTLACWGAGTADTDCPGDSVDCRQSRPPTGSFVQVVVGNVHSCAMTADRKVKCWGYPGEGAGDGRLTPPVAFQ